MTRLSVNKIIKYLILSDLAFWTGWGLINPIFAIFITEKIEGGSPLVVGLSAAIFWIVRSVLRVPMGVFLDGSPSEKDDYLFLVLGLLLSSLTSFGFIFAKLAWHIYLLQAINAVGLAMSLSAWTAIFTRHIDKGKESTEWGLDATAIGLGIGLAGAVGGWAVNVFGFEPIFFAVGVLGIVGTILLFGLRNEIKGVFDSNWRLSLKDVFHRDHKGI